LAADTNARLDEIIGSEVKKAL
jgi:hypothetical protein